MGSIERALNLIKIQSTYISLMVFVYSPAWQKPAINDIREGNVKKPLSIRLSMQLNAI